MHEVQERYAGAVIGNFERNGYHDSDFFAIVYDEENDVVKSVQTGTTRFPSPVGKIPVDITDENLAKAEKAAARQAYRQIKLDAEIKAEQVEVGKVVTFTRNFNGRTQPKAKEGELLNVATVWEESWNGSYPVEKVKGWTADGREFKVDRMIVEVANPADYMPTEEEMREQAANWAAREAKSKNFRGILEGWLHR